MHLIACNFNIHSTILIATSKEIYSNITQRWYDIEKQILVKDTYWTRHATRSFVA
jgi:hypothetical protein